MRPGTFNLRMQVLRGRCKAVNIKGALFAKVIYMRAISRLNLLNINRLVDHKMTDMQPLWSKFTGQGLKHISQSRLAQCNPMQNERRLLYRATTPMHLRTKLYLYRFGNM